MIPTGPCPIENITGIHRFNRPPGFHCRTQALPEHLLHFVVSGAYELQIDKRRFQPETGSIIYYFGSEEVIWRGNREEVCFYSVSFVSTQIYVPPPESRIIPNMQSQRSLWDRLWRWSKNTPQGDSSMQAYSLLLAILEGLEIKASETPDLLWRSLEQQIRSEKLYCSSIDSLARRTACSARSLYRHCKRETGKSPAERIREIRNEEAKGMLRYSRMRIGEIGDYLAYRSAADFSRSFKHNNGLSPGEYRADIHRK